MNLPSGQCAGNWPFSDLPVSMPCGTTGHPMKVERTNRVVIAVKGEPAPGGSKSAFLHRSTGRIVVTDAGGKRTKVWRSLVAAAARMAMGSQEVIAPPIGVTVVFRVTRPKSHLTLRGALRLGSPVLPVSRPDATKLLRSTEDALTGIVWGDDAHIAEQWVYRIYARPDEEPGATITAYHIAVSHADGLAWEAK
jgi:Holliday junction resolvase RusA-like endonuclease